MMERALSIVSNWIQSRHSAIYTLLWGFVFGILVSSFLPVAPLVSILFFVIALGVYGVDKIYYGGVSRGIFLAAILLAAFACGSMRYSIKDFHEVQQPADSGVVVTEPEHRDADTRFVVRTDNGEQILVSTDRLSGVEYGDAVTISGQSKRPGIIVDELSGREFDYGAYLAKDDIYWTMSHAAVSITGSGAASRIIYYLLKVKSSFVSHIKSILPEPEASLLSGLTVAGKEALPASVLQDFKNAGVVHIVVLSGYNVTIIAEFFLFLLGFLGKRRAAIFSATGIVLFTLMTGATATVVRAAIMVLALLLGKIINRPYAPGRILLFTAFLMLIWNPKYLVFDPSFQLSFLAMLALVYVVPIAEKYLQKLPEKLGFKEIVAVTIATQLTVLPFLMYSVGSVSLVSLVSNFLILVIVPYTMLVGFVAVVLSYASAYLAWPVAFLSHMMLKYILLVAHTLGNLPLAAVQINNVSAWFTVVLYALLFAAMTLLRRNSLRKLAS